MMRKNIRNPEFSERDNKKDKGFSLLEVIIGIALVGIALLGLAQLFTYSVMNNSRSDRMTNSNFLAQEKVDTLRNLTSTELNALTAGAIDEQIDVNNDGTFDFRRLTQVQNTGANWSVRILVFSEAQLGIDAALLLQNPSSYRVKADLNTLISR